MAKLLNSKVTTDLSVQLELNEEEVRALSGIFGYNVDIFLKYFYEKMGRTYVQPYENGVRSLHKQIGMLMAGPIMQIGKARQAIANSR